MVQYFWYRMRPDFFRKPCSLEEEEKRRLVAAAFRGMVTPLDIAETSDCAETRGRGKLLAFPGNSTRFERMTGLLQESRNPNRAERTRTFLAYWDELAAEMGAARRARKEAMAAAGNWDFPGLMRTDLDFVRILAGLRWMAFRYRLGFSADLPALSALVQQAMAFAAVA